MLNIFTAKQNLEIIIIMTIVPSENGHIFYLHNLRKKILLIVDFCLLFQ
jgi:chemotaxis signal transduction protein